MELTDELLSAYNLGTSDLQVAPIRNGLINSTWRIDNPYNSYILQKVNHQIFKIPENIASNVRMVADYLQKHHQDYFLFLRCKRTETRKWFILSVMGISD